ncbi:MAG: single-stranded DNA-binding protein [Geovibrio sp.]|jgi:single-strand DNA-binding protein|nr:single-stranded DNA-binding protein [Geovibrio ferrireducens]MCD8490432.1 single-stranded DNA-binding protein [Geovibrio sp.]
MGFFNKVVLLGNCTRNPEVRYVPGRDLAVAKFGLAVNSRRSKDKEETMFIDIVAFGKLGEICGEYLTKGSPVLVEGRLSQNVWEQEGQKRSKHEVIAENIQLVSSRKGDKGGDYSGSDGGFSSGGSSDDFSEDDIPF